MYTVDEERKLLLRLASGKSGRTERFLPPQLPGLHPGDFGLPAHRLIWRALVELAYFHLGITPQAVAARVSARGTGEAVREALGLLEVDGPAG